MKQRLFVIAILALLVGGGWWYLYSGGRFGTPEPLPRTFEKSSDMLQEAEARVSAPPPLRAKDESSAARLTRNGILLWTNAHRKDGGATALTLNAALNAAAETKLNDLFAKQYFEHVSPDGVGPGELVGEAAYLYIMVGENLALGNFEDDQTLVQAWMDSPGHRANILEPRFTEIGIAVGQGAYEGRRTWVAVQEFGRPQASCPKPDAAIAAAIKTNEAQIDAWQAEAKAEQEEIERSKRPRTQEEADAYHARVDAYNALIKRINALISELQGEIAVYNGQVQAYNACVTS